MVPETPQQWFHEIKRIAKVTDEVFIGRTRRAGLRKGTVTSVLDDPTANCAGDLPWKIARVFGVQNGPFRTFSAFRRRVMIVREREHITMDALAAQIEAGKASVKRFLDGGCPRCTRVLVYARVMGLSVWPRFPSRRLLATAKRNRIMSDIKKYRRR